MLGMSLGLQPSSPQPGPPHPGGPNPQMTGTHFRQQLRAQVTDSQTEAVVLLGLKVALKSKPRGAATPTARSRRASRDAATCWRPWLLM